MVHHSLLRRLGFSEYEAKLYLALSSLGPSKASEIARLGNVPRNKVYETLEGLAHKNYVEILPLSPKKYRIIDPDILRKEVEDLQKGVDHFIETIETPEEQSEDLLWLIKGQKAIMKRMEIQTAKTRNELLSCNRMTLGSYKNLKAIKDAVDRGVDVKLIVEFPPRNRLVFEEWKKTGAKIRAFNEKKFGSAIPRIAIYDKKCARITIGFPEIRKTENYTTLWTESKGLVHLLREQLLMTWRQATKLQ